MAINRANVGPQERPKGEYIQNRIIRPSVDPGLHPGLDCGALSGLVVSFRTKREIYSEKGIDYYLEF
jgi:hypothetical protein